MKIFVSVLMAGLFLSGCTEKRVKKYQDVLEPRISKAKKTEIDKMFGTPEKCIQEGPHLKCEYRTAAMRNTPVSDMYRKEPGMGPDLTPYDHFDVIHVFFDGLGVMQDWKPIVVEPY